MRCFNRLLLLGFLGGFVVLLDRSQCLAVQHPMQAQPVLSTMVSDSRGVQSVGLPEGRMDMKWAEVRQPTARPDTDESVTNSQTKLEYFAIVVGGAMGLAVLLLIVVMSSTKQEPPL